MAPGALPRSFAYGIADSAYSDPSSVTRIRLNTSGPFALHQGGQATAERGATEVRCTSLSP